MPHISGHLLAGVPKTQLRDFQALTVLARFAVVLSWISLLEELPLRQVAANLQGHGKLGCEEKRVVHKSSRAAESSRTFRSLPGTKGFGKRAGEKGRGKVLETDSEMRRGHQGGWCRRFLAAQ